MPPRGATSRRSPRSAAARGTSLAAARAAVERSGVGPTIGSRREADAWLALAAAHRERLEGHDDPATWDRLARALGGARNPYEVAKARWHQAEAILGSGEGRAGRGRARPALEEAARIAVELGARPLLREVRQLAGRAMIRLPSTVDGCSSRSAPRLAASRAGTGDDSAPWSAVGPGRPTGRGDRGAGGGGAARRGRGRGRPRGTIGALIRRPRHRRRAPVAAAGHVRAVAPRARGAGPDRRGPDEPRDRRAALHQPEDRRRPRRQHPREARRLRPRRGRRGRDPARA